MANILIGRTLNKDTDSVTVVSGLVPEAYDRIELTYDVPPHQGDVIQAVYKQGATTVATLDITYNGDRNIASVVRS
jgi:hypothetical protein